MKRLLLCAGLLLSVPVFGQSSQQPTPEQMLPDSASTSKITAHNTSALSFVIQPIRFTPPALLIQSGPRGRGSVLQIEASFWPRCFRLAPRSGTSSLPNTDSPTELVRRIPCMGAILALSGRHLGRQHEFPNCADNGDIFSKTARISQQVLECQWHLAAGVVLPLRKLATGSVRRCLVTFLHIFRRAENVECRPPHDQFPSAGT